MDVLTAIIILIVVAIIVAVLHLPGIVLGAAVALLLIAFLLDRAGAFRRRT